MQKLTKVSSQSESHNAPLAVDGDSDSAFRCEQSGYPHWWMVDLGDKYQLYLIIISANIGKIILLMVQCFQLDVQFVP